MGAQSPQRVEEVEASWPCVTCTPWLGAAVWRNE